MKLLEMIEAVKETNLTKTDLENYHTQLTSLYAQMMWELAECEKREAIYFLEQKNDAESDVAVKRRWRGTPEGLRLIELKNYEKATTKVLSSLKNRMYSTY